MRKIAVLCVILLSSALSYAQDDVKLKVMSYNLRFGEISVMKEFADFISEEQPDLVALQECDWATMRERAPKQNGVKFINELAYHTGMFGVYGKAIDYKGGYYGVGILSKYPIISMKRLLLPNPGKHEQRALLIVEVELPNAETMTFACTHLEVKSSLARNRQVSFIKRKLRNYDKLVLAGDMNAEPDSPEMKKLCRDWVKLTNDELTFSVKKPQTKIDWIVGKPAKSVHLLSTEVLRDVKLSDHYPIVSEIIINY